MGAPTDDADVHQVDGRPAGGEPTDTGPGGGRGPDGEPAELGKVVSRSLGWSLGGQILSRIGVFATGVALARMLTEEDFGVFATALLVVNVAMAFNELGMIPALVNWQGDVREPLGTGLTLAFGTSLVLYAVLFVAAGPFADLAGTPEAAGVLRVLGLSVIVDGLVAPYWALLARNFLQLRQTMAETIGMLAYIVAALGVAAADGGAMALAVGRVAGTVLTGALFIVLAPYRVRPAFDRLHARLLFRYGWSIAAGELMAQLVLNIDYLIVGRALGTATLGVYLLAFNLSSWPVSIVTTAISRVSFAGFSRLAGDRARLRTGFARSFGLAAAATVPLVLAVAVLAPEVVRLLYGTRWLEAVTPVRYLVVLGGLRVLLELLAEVVAATGRPTAMFRARAAWLVVLIPALVVGAEADGLRGVGIAHLAAALLVVTPILLVECTRSGVVLADLARVLVRPVLASPLAVAAMLALRNVPAPLLVQLALAGSVGMLAYAAVLVPRNGLLSWFWVTLRGRREPDAAPA